MMYSKWLFMSLGGKKVHTHTYRGTQTNYPKLVPFVPILGNEK